MPRFSDYRRVLRPVDLAYVAGDMLKHTGARYTKVAAIIALPGVAAYLIGDRVLGFDISAKWNLMAMPLAGALGSTVLGNTLSGVANFFSNDKLLTASANSLEQMEDYREQEEKDELKHIMWQRVLKYESRYVNDDADRISELARIRNNGTILEQHLLDLPDEVKDHYGITDENIGDLVNHIATFKPLSDQLEATAQGFQDSFGYALDESLPQLVEIMLTGFTQRLLTDYIDGAILTNNDTKLNKLYHGNDSLKGVREELGIHKMMKWLSYVSEPTEPRWFRWTTNKIGIEAGKLKDRFNRLYVPDTHPPFFGAQAMVWPSEHIDRAIYNRFGPEEGRKIVQHLHDEQRMMIYKIFSDDKTTAHNQIYWMVGRDYVRGLNLRLRYDAEFAAGAEDFSPVGDVCGVGQLVCKEGLMQKKVDRAMVEARANIAQANAFLMAEMPGVLDNPLLVRAARNGYHYDKMGVRQMIQRADASSVGLMEHILRYEPLHTSRLVDLRIFYELGRHNIASYTRLVDRLGGFD